MTTYTAVAIEPVERGSLVTLNAGADYFRAQITDVDSAHGTVTTALKPLVEYIDHGRADWVASDEAQKTFWRATYLGDGRFKLHGPPVTHAAFAPDGVLRLWEYGAGDHVRQSTSASLRRLAAGQWELSTDATVQVAIPARSVEVTLSGKRRQIAATRQPDGWLAFELPAAEEPYRLAVARD